MLEVNVTPDVRAALAANRTIRCLLKVKYDRDSRHSRVAIAWAQSRTEKLTRAMLEQIGQQTAGFSIQLNIVELIPKYALVCYDLFLEECDKDVRSEIDKSHERPVYMITRRAKVFYVRRSGKVVETRVASRYREIGEYDKGPRPFFVDLLNPPLYDGGVRIEKPEGDDPKADLSDENQDVDGGPEKTGVTKDASKEDMASEDGATTQVAVDGEVIGTGNTAEGKNARIVTDSTVAFPTAHK